MWVTIALAAVVIAVCVGLAPQLFAVSHDPEFARVAGLRVPAYNLVVAVLAAVWVTVAMRTVGLLLVSALMVVPVATSQQVTRSFRTTLVAAMASASLRRSAACCWRRTLSAKRGAPARRSCCCRWSGSPRRGRSGCGRRRAG